MIFSCPYCKRYPQSSDGKTLIRSSGFFYRKSDRKKIKRYHCQCGKHFSLATFDHCYRQHKRHLNQEISLHLCSGVSIRRCALLIKANKNTVAKKLIFLGLQARHTLYQRNLMYPKSTEIEFDDLETMHWTKLKPLSVSLAVEAKTRRILGFQIAQMPAKGKLAKKSIRKYGYRADQRSLARANLFKKLNNLVDPGVCLKSDQNPHYPLDVKKYFPLASHITFKGIRGAVTGQGELKKASFDPLFSLNHTCAMLRANVNRLFRKTWCTTKKIENLEHHIAIYAAFHNHVLLENK